MNTYGNLGPGISGRELLDRLAKADPETAARVEEILRARGPIGKQLHVARMQAQLDAHEVAERAGVTVEVVIGIEHGTHVATPSELALLGSALDIDFPVDASGAA